jgi:ribosome-dependent ATPase
MSDARHREAAAERIAYMPQGLGRNLYPTLTVTENIDFHGRLFSLRRRERMDRIERLLNATGLSPFPDRPAGKLSGGMKQKLSLCCALVHDPDLLILDEPTTGVDPLSRRQFWSLIADIRADRPSMTVLVSTAYMDEAQAFERIIAIDGGLVLADGVTRDVLAQAGTSRLEDAYRHYQSNGSAVVDDFDNRPRGPNSGPPAIVAEGLTCRFGDFTAVDNVSFRIERSEIFGFLGSNGCGKTTTMKMLTGLLDPTEGRAEILGRPISSRDMETRLQVGYMSQGFSLYEELTVTANLVLHARLYRISEDQVGARVDNALDRFGLQDYADALPTRLPLGIRQRLQLAAACLHRPRMLILDEPTSGVDPAGRNLFWKHLFDLSRDQGVTIFVSTHFMNEAERCDRISLMHRGRVLAIGTPRELTEARHANTLEDAFIDYLSVEPDVANGAQPNPGLEPVATVEDATMAASPSPHALDGLPQSVSRLLAFTRRELFELLRDRIRLAFAVVIPIFLLCIFSFGISFDVEGLTFAVFDRDRSSESQSLIQAFEGSRYFETRPPIVSDEEVDRRLKTGELRLVLGVPPGFGKSLLKGDKPEISVWIDGANTFRAETVRSYVQGVLSAYQNELLFDASAGAEGLAMPIDIRPRYVYNQAFRSVNAISPGVIMLVLMLIPAMMAALGVVREKEIGSIANFQASPAHVAEFLIGKQIAYAAIGLVNVVMLAATAVLAFGVPFTGSLPAFLFGGLLYVLASTGFGIMISTLVSTQVAATFATAIVTVIPSVNFSGLMYPVSSIEGAGRVVGYAFPAAWFQTISLGTFAKGLGIAELWHSYLALGGFTFVFMALACLLLSKQEP